MMYVPLMDESFRRTVRKLQRVAVGGGPTGPLGIGFGTPELPEASFRAEYGGGFEGIDPVYYRK